MHTGPSRTETAIAVALVTAAIADHRGFLTYTAAPAFTFPRIPAHLDRLETATRHLEWTHVKLAWVRGWLGGLVPGLGAANEEWEAGHARFVWLGRVERLAAYERVGRFGLLDVLELVGGFKEGAC